MHWKNFGEMLTDDIHKVYFSGEEDRYEYGVRFLVHKDMMSAVLGCQQRLQQSDLDLLESSSFFQHHHRTGLCTNNWTS